MLYEQLTANDIFTEISFAL